MGKKSVLGRGLGALITEEAKSSPKKDDTINEISLEDISVNPFQPRATFDEDALNELADSIKTLGLIQPITVRKTDDNKYQLITGERRFRASKKAGLKSVPAYVRTADDQAMLEMALVENIQRENLDAIEIAISYNRLIDECKLTQENLSERIGKQRSTVSNYLRLLKLPAEIQLAIRRKKIGMGHARTLVNIENIEDQLNICNQIIEDDLSVRKTEELIKAKSQEKKQKVWKNTKKTPEEYLKLEKHLSDHFKSKVKFKKNSSGKGSIVIPFNSDDDLERIIAIFDKMEN